MKKRKILLVFITILVALVPFGIAGYIYQENINDLLTKKQIMDGLKYEIVEKKVTITFIPSRMTLGEGKEKMYMYSPDEVTDEDGNSYTTGMIFSFPKKISDKTCKTTPFEGVAEVLKYKIPDAIMKDAKLAEQYGAKAVKEKDGYYLLMPYKVTVNGSTYENKQITKILNSKGTIKTLKKKLYEQYMNNQGFEIRMKLKKMISVVGIFDLITVSIAACLYRRWFCRGGSLNA